MKDRIELNQFFMKNVYRVFAALVLLMTFLSLTGICPAGESSEEVVAITLSNWPPQYLVDEKTGKPAGFAIDIMDRVADLAGIKARYLTCKDWPDAFRALENGQAVLAPNIGITEERMGLYDFTAPYETFRISIFVRRSTTDIHDENDLAGKKVGVVRKNQGLVLMEKSGGSDLQIYDSMEDCFMALLAGKIDALVYPEQVIMELAIRSGLENKIKIIGAPLQEIKRGMAVSKGHPELYQKLDEAIRQVINDPEYKKIYTKWYGRPEPFWTGTRIIVLMGAALGLTIGGMLVWRHVSILKLNRSLAEAGKRLSRIIENTNAGYFFIDQAGRFRHVNQSWLTLHGYDSSDEIVGRAFTLTQVTDDLEKAEQNFKLLLSGQAITTGEFSRRYKNGSIGYHTFSAHPVLENGQVVGVEGFIIDAGERRRAQEQTHQTQKAESLSRMAGAVAHHFNNQLSVIMGNLEIAMEDLPKDAENRGNLAAAMKAAQMSSEVSSLMLTYLGQGIGKGQLLDFSEVCRRNLSIIAAMLPKNIALETDLLSSGPMVFANSNQVQLILNHLITNSVEALGGHNGKIRLAVKFSPISEIFKHPIVPGDWKPDGDVYACLEVTDTGCGISGKDIQKIFDPFFTTKFVGRGLGLPAVLGIVKAWQGAISVETQKNQGTSFRVLLPIAKDKIPVQPEWADEGHEIGEGGSVLLVDDQESVRKMGEALLKRLGFITLSAAGGKEALELFHAHQGSICCVITDLTMPELDGWETLYALRKIQPGLPVILSSGYEEGQAMNRDNPEQPNAFLHKPYSKIELKKALDQALQSLQHGPQNL